MDVEILFQELEASHALREDAAALARRHLDPLRAQLTRVSILLVRRNGGTRRVEFRCQVTARGPRLPATIVDHRGSSALPALDLAIERTARAVRHELDRARARERSSDDPG